MDIGAGPASTAAGTEVCPLPRRAPGAMGVQAEAVEQFLDALADDPQIEPHSLMLVRGGVVVAEGWWAPYSAGRVHHLSSLGRMFTATAVGFALAEGRLGTDDRIVDHFPEFAAQSAAPGGDRIRIRDALALAPGSHRDLLRPADPAGPGNLAGPVRGLRRPGSLSAAGTRFSDDRTATWAVAALQRAVGARLPDYLRPRLFDPLGIGPVAWHEHPPGQAVGFGGFYATTEAVAKLGLLYLREGRWQGRQVLPAGWGVDGQRAGLVPGSAHRDRRIEDGHHGDGADGRFCLVSPEHDAVLVLTTAAVRTRAVLEAVRNVLLPGIGPAVRRRVPRQPRAVDPDGRLARRLAELRLPASAGGVVDDRWVGVHRGSGLTVIIPPQNGNGVCPLARIDDGRITMTVPIGTGKRWVVVEPGAGSSADASPVAVSGGVTADRDGTPRLRLDLAFLQSPHRLFVDVHLHGSQPGVSATWGAAPSPPIDQPPTEQSPTEQTPTDRGARWAGVRRAGRG